jgi:hypothetical protein
MIDQASTKDTGNYRLFVFSFVLAILTYGFAITNFTVTIDNEMPILPDFAMDLGRWGQNLIRYHLFHGYLPYFSILLSLCLFSLAATRACRLFKFTGLSAYIYCGLFVTFPQLSYQVVFGIMADVAGLGALLSVVLIEMLLKGFQGEALSKKLIWFSMTAVLLMFMLSIYQAFILIPASICLILVFQNTYGEDFSLRHEIQKLFVFVGVAVVGVALYLVSVKIICPPIQDNGYLFSFVSGHSNNSLSDFFMLWIKNLAGQFYYGEASFFLAGVSAAVLVVLSWKNMRFLVARLLILGGILLLPFIMSAFITNGYHPPRLYISSNFVFAFLLVTTLDRLNIAASNATKIAFAALLIVQVYFVTSLFYSANNIYLHDKKIAERIDNIIQNKYPSFYTGDKTVYFYGFFPFEFHQDLRLKDSEIFGGSFFTWDNGSNYRIINFFKKANVADYNRVNTQEKLDKVKDSVAQMPKWPEEGSIRLINGIVVVKLGNEPGAPVSFDY